MVEVQSVRLVVSPKGEHPEKDMPRPDYDGAPTGQVVFRVDPRSTEVPVVNVAGEITLGPGIVRSLSFEIEAEHEPHQGMDLRNDTGGEMESGGQFANAHRDRPCVPPRLARPAALVRARRKGR